MASVSDALFPPGMNPHAECGMPQKFTTLRGQQALMAERISNSSCHTVHAAPTGIGKTLAYMLASTTVPHRTIVLTATKELQNQISHEFEELVGDIRGASNYPCKSAPGLDCGIMRRAGCEDAEYRTCTYEQALSEACRKPVLLTNYAWWLSHPEFRSKPYSLLVMDEAHQVAGAVTQFCSARLSPTETEYLQQITRRKIEHSSVDSIVSWSLLAKDAVENRLRVTVKSNVQQLRFLVSLHDKLSRMSGLTQPAVILFRDGELFVSPVWPQSVCRENFFTQPVDVRYRYRSVLVSATITADTCHLLGLRPGDYEYYEYDSDFPPENGPVYLYDSVRLNYRSSQEDEQRVLELMLKIVRSRQDRNGIIHTGSYQRAAKVKQYLKHKTKHRIFGNENSKDLRQAVMSYRKSPLPALLISPSVSTGHDFPDEQAEFQVVFKCPYPDMKDPVTVLRAESMKAYPVIIMTQTLVQMSGRGLRHSDDRCETFVVDGSALAVYQERPGLFPSWFRRRVSILKPDVLPDAPQRMGG